jgi:tetratricopeptide (TPR) repeat protein
MRWWPFKPEPKRPLAGPDLQDYLVKTAASGSPRKLLAVCRLYKDDVIASLEAMGKLPEPIRFDPDAANRYVQSMIAVAQCLANDCQAPALWNKLIGTPDSNPLLKWNQWVEAMPQRTEQLDYDTLIAEAEDFVSRSQSWQGEGARREQAIVQGTLGKLLFESGRVRDSIAPFDEALKACLEINDVEGQYAYLNALMEVHRYLGDKTQAVHFVEQLFEITPKDGKSDKRLQAQIRILRRGEPLCRVVCIRDGKQLELEEISHGVDGEYQFQFQRNRPALSAATTLVSQGNALGSSGRLADALEKYQQAQEIDEHDPDPVYQMGVCLLDLGAYAQAREAFVQVERLAPGWFRCRSDRWLADGLDTGTITDTEYHLLRILDDSQLPREEAMQIARKAIDDFPAFAPFYLALGDLERNQGNRTKAIELYRRGLELVGEPDLESRLLCAVAGLLPADSTERADFVTRLHTLDGSLVSQASARLMQLR